MDQPTGYKPQDGQECEYSPRKSRKKRNNKRREQKRNQITKEEDNRETPWEL